MNAGASASTPSIAPPAVLLDAADVPAERALEEQIRPARSLHRLARDALDGIFRVGANSAIDRNLGNWFPWRRYIACHKRAYDIIGAGIIGAYAQYIPETRDGNRGYQPRLDFVVYRADGTVCRLRPGSRPRADAQLLFQ